MNSLVHQLHIFCRARVPEAAVRQRIAALDEVDMIMHSALADSGLANAARVPAGDGWAAALPAGADVALVLAEVPRRVRPRLSEHNARRVPEARLRLVVAFAAGPTADGPDGPVGEAPREAARLAEARADTPLAIVLSGELYDQYVVPGFRVDLDPGDFRPVAIGGTKAWLA